MISTSNLTGYELPQSKYCKHCGRTDNLKTIYVKSYNQTAELTYCKRCWDKIMDLVWPSFGGKR